MRIIARWKIDSDWDLCRLENGSGHFCLTDSPNHIITEGMNKIKSEKIGWPWKLLDESDRLVENHIYQGRVKPDWTIVEGIESVSCDCGTWDADHRDIPREADCPIAKKLAG